MKASSPEIDIALLTLRSRGFSEADILARLYGNRRKAHAEKHKRLHREIGEMEASGIKRKDIVIYIMRVYRMSFSTAYFHIRLLRRQNIESASKGRETESKPTSEFSHD